MLTGFVSVWWISASSGLVLCVGGHSRHTSFLSPVLFFVMFKCLQVHISASGLVLVVSHNKSVFSPGSVFLSCLRVAGIVNVWIFASGFVLCVGCHSIVNRFFPVSVFCPV